MSKEDEEYYTVSYHIYHEDWKRYIILRAEIEDAINNSKQKTIPVETIKEFFDIQNKVRRKYEAQIKSVKTNLLTYANHPSFAFKIEKSRQIPVSEFNDEYIMQEVFSFEGFIDYFFSIYRWDSDNGLGGIKDVEEDSKHTIMHWAYWLINEYLQEIDPGSKSISQYKRLSIIGLITAQFGYLLTEEQHKNGTNLFGGYTEYLYSSVKSIKKRDTP